MRLMLLRHAKAEKAAQEQRDRDRRLAPRGQRDAHILGVYMAHHKLAPDLALVSTAVRTRETWAALAPAFPECEATFEGSLYDATPDAIVSAVSTHGLAAATLLVVGHNPGLHSVALALIASGDVETRERLNEGLPTSGLVVLDFALKSWSKLHGRSGRLERFITARQVGETTV